MVSSLGNVSAAEAMVEDWDEAGADIDSKVEVEVDGWMGAERDSNSETFNGDDSEKEGEGVGEGEDEGEREGADDRGREGEGEEVNRYCLNTSCCL